MKKICLLILVILLLFFCGCNTEPVETTEPTVATIPTNSDGSLVVPTLPEIDKMDYSESMTVIRIIINPDFELELSFENIVLAINPKNDDAVAFLDHLDLIGLPYDLAIAAILDAAKSENYLKDGVGISISVKNVADDGHLIPSGILETPFEAYRTQSGITFTYQVSTKNVIDLANSTRTAKYYDPYGWEHTVYFLGDKEVMDSQTRDDGTVMEVYFLENQNYNIHIEYFPDGSYSYSHANNDTSSGYRVFPDGSREYYSDIYPDKDGIARSWFMNRDGITFDSILYHEDDRLIRSSSVRSDGVIEENTYYPNGNVAMSIEQSNERCSTLYYDEEGNCTSENIKWNDGTEEIFRFEYDEDGRLIRSSLVSSNGLVLESTYYPNGNVAMSIEQSNERCSTFYYDEEGNCTSENIKWNDGTEEIHRFENGVCTESIVIHPDGTTETRFCE